MKQSQPKGREQHARAKQRSAARRSARVLPGQRRVDARDGALEQYFGDVQSTSMLTVAQETELAKQIEQLETAYWTALLSYAPALDVVLAALARHVEERPAKLEALRKLAQPHVGASRLPSAAPVIAEQPADWAALAGEAAEHLRQADVTRSGLHAVDAAVREVFTIDPAAQRYLARVDEARGAQQRAKNRLASANLRLVISMARRYGKGQLALSDLIQEGNLGLMRAVERFDYRRGFRFSTYAGWWIRHGLNRAFANHGRLVRVPVHTLGALQRTAHASLANLAKTGDALTDDELAEETGFSQEKLTFLREHAAIARPTSLDQAVGGERDQTLHDLLPAPAERDLEEELDREGWTAQLQRLLQTLTPIEATILRYRFGLEDDEELTLREIGLKYNLSRERIRQLQNQALDKLRSTLRRTQHGRERGDVVAA